METPSNSVTTIIKPRSENPFIRRIPMNAATPASLGLRICAFLIDYILTLLLFGVAIAIASMIKNSAPSLANWVMYAGYFAVAIFFLWNFGYLSLLDGQSIGKRLTGIRIRREDKAGLDIRTVLLRHLLGYPVSLLCAGLGFIWIAIHPRQRAWHDLIAGTIVIKD